MPHPFSLYDTRRREIAPLDPIQEGLLRVYTCGHTVYNEPTVGNWRTFISEDVLVRALRHFDYRVERVMNVTDVGHLTDDADEGEDKLEVGARREGLTAWDVAKKYEASFVRGLDQLHLEHPDRLVRATDRIAQQIALIQQLEKGGHTYRLADGIYYDTSTFPAYADFAHLDLEGLRGGARVEMQEGKRNPSDFALWKFSPTDRKRDMEWESPWGVGFPGWHIECSAIIRSELGDEIDIHCGGVDHIPVHHTNEIAQSEAVTGRRLARHWFHADFLLVDGGKMSKSLGNGYTLADLEARGVEPLAFKLFTYGAHYRSKLNFTWEAVEGAQRQLERLRRLVREGEGTETDAHPYLIRFKHALSDQDLNIPVALSILHEGLSRLAPGAGARDWLVREADSILALDLLAAGEEAPAEVAELQAQRDRFRAEKNWAESDRLRGEIARLGWAVEDREAGSVLRKL